MEAGAGAPKGLAAGGAKSALCVSPNGEEVVDIQLEPAGLPPL
jgi:hypothetical protein